jgi:hypothetical protein
LLSPGRTPLNRRQGDPGGIIQLPGKVNAALVQAAGRVVVALPERQQADLKRRVLISAGANIRVRLAGSVRSVFPFIASGLPTG